MEEVEDPAVAAGDDAEERAKGGAGLVEGAKDDDLGDLDLEAGVGVVEVEREVEEGGGGGVDGRELSLRASSVDVLAC